MDIPMQIRYYTNEHAWLCFNHAVEEANKGKEVKTEIDDFSSDYYMGNTRCTICELANKTPKTIDVTLYKQTI